MKMKFPVHVLLLALSMTTFVQAEIRCSTDFFGNQQCTTDTGDTWKGSTDFLGNEVWRDEEGRSFRGSKDFFGDVIYRDESGHTIEKTTDYFGDPVLQDQDSGEVLHCRTNFLGDTICD